MNPRHAAPEIARLIVKLESIAVLSQEDKEALAGLPYRTKTFDENSDLVREGDVPPECCLIVEGFVCRYKLVGEGRRQIMSFHLPGDLPDLQSLHLKRMDHSLGALTPVRAAFIPHEAMQELIRQHPNIAATFWRDTLIDAAVFREWLTGVGRRSARARISHLLCEIRVRLQVLGLAGSDGFDLPITQSELADALGLSPVHVNRVLQELRGEGVIASRGRFVVVHDWERLKAEGEFDVGYLHLLADPG